METIRINVENPDSASMVTKDEVNINISMFDISASGYFNKLNTNYSQNELILTIPEREYINSSSYYTPIYTEKLNYDVWLTKINKNFQELD